MMAYIFFISYTASIWGQIMGVPAIAGISFLVMILSKEYKVENACFACIGYLINVTINNLNGKEASIRADKILASGYVNALRDINKELGLSDDISLSNLIKFSDIFTVQKIAEDEEKLWNDVKEVAESALEKFVIMRNSEGEALKSDLLCKLAKISGLLEKVEKGDVKIVREVFPTEIILR